MLKTVSGSYLPVGPLDVEPHKRHRLAGPALVGNRLEHFSCGTSSAVLLPVVVCPPSGLTPRREVDLDGVCTVAKGIFDALDSENSVSYSVEGLRCPRLKTVV